MQKETIISTKTFEIAELEKDFGFALISGDIIALENMLIYGFSPNYTVNGYDILEIVYDAHHDNNQKLLEVIDLLILFGLELYYHNVSLPEKIEEYINNRVDDDNIINCELVRIYKYIYRDDVNLLAKADIPKNYRLNQIDIPAFISIVDAKESLKYLWNCNFKFSFPFNDLVSRDTSLANLLNDCQTEMHDLQRSRQESKDTIFSGLFDIISKKRYLIENHQDEFAKEKKDEKYAKEVENQIFWINFRFLVCVASFVFGVIYHLLNSDPSSLEAALGIVKRAAGYSVLIFLSIEIYFDILFFISNSRTDLTKNTIDYVKKLLLRGYIIFLVLILIYSIL